LKNSPSRTLVIAGKAFSPGKITTTSVSCSVDVGAVFSLEKIAYLLRL
jgi:hypothetical protein